MLNYPKKFELIQVAPTHVDLFVDHYDQLRRGALQFSEHDPAEDLLHDFFLHFRITKPELAAVENLDGFLYVIMRNLHLSQMRRATHTPFAALPAVEHDTVDVGLWASDPRDRIRMQDELAAVANTRAFARIVQKLGRF